MGQIQLLGKDIGQQLRLIIATGSQALFVQGHRRHRVEGQV